MKTLRDGKLNPSSASPLFEIARLLVRLDHVATIIANADHGVLVSGRKTQAPKQTSGRERLSRPDLCVAMKEVI